jgi:hypothetical protein
MLRQDESAFKSGQLSANLRHRPSFTGHRFICGYSFQTPATLAWAPDYRTDWIFGRWDSGFLADFGFF